MNVLSLFDGMSCGQIALNRAGIKYDKYYASEIDKHAIAVTQHNYPNTKQLGDVTKINTVNAPKIDLLIGGSPCQGFSFAGKQLNFDDPRSKLFFEYVRLLKELKPKYFLLENVVMKQEYQDVISEALGVKPVMINSALVSAQNRKRLYWTNIADVCQPEDKGVVLKDIAEITIEDNTKDLSMHSVLNFRGFKTDNSKKRILKNIRSGLQKANCLTSSNTDNPAGCGCSNVVFKTEQGYDWRKTTKLECERLQTVPEGYTQIVSEGVGKRMLGNGWTVDVIAHIFKGLKSQIDKNLKQV